MCLCSLFEEVVGRSEGSILSAEHLVHFRSHDPDQGPDPDPVDDLTLSSDNANLSINTFVLLMVAISMQVGAAYCSQGSIVLPERNMPMILPVCVCVCVQAFQSSSVYDRVEKLLDWMETHFAALKR